MGEVMESKHGEFLACFERYTDNTVGAPEVQLVVDVRRTGAVERVRILPAVLEGSALGTCLSEVAGRLHFSTIHTATSFQVPLRVTGGEL